jgi:hypothetical protein
MSASGSGGVSSEAQQAACARGAIATAPAHTTPCELGQVMTGGKVVRTLGEGSAGGAAAATPEELEAAIQAEIDGCLLLMSEYPACAAELVRSNECSADALFICVEHVAEPMLRWRTFDCGPVDDEVGRCLEASL